MIIGICGVVFAALAAFVPLKEIVELVNIGTLFAFVVVNLGVIILRRTRPDLPRGYRVPLVPWFPIVGTLLLRLPDGRPARHHLGAVLHLDGARRRDLLRLRDPPLAPAQGRGRQPRGGAPRL